MDMQDKKTPVPQYYFSPGEWDRLGCGPLPPERDMDRQDQQQLEKSWTNPEDAGKGRD
jgi:hypothetical protein